MKNLCLLIFIVVLSSCNSLSKKNHTVKVVSPDHRIQTIFTLNENGEPLYSIVRDDKLLIDKSRLGFVLKGNDSFSSDFTILKSTPSTFNETWKPVVGQFKNIKNNYNQLVVTIQESAGKKKVT